MSFSNIFKIMAKRKRPFFEELEQATLTKDYSRVYQLCQEIVPEVKKANILEPKKPAYLDLLLTYADILSNQKGYEEHAVKLYKVVHKATSYLPTHKNLWRKKTFKGLENVASNLGDNKERFYLYRFLRQDLTHSGKYDNLNLWKKIFEGMIDNVDAEDEASLLLNDLVYTESRIYYVEDKKQPLNEFCCTQVHAFLKNNKHDYNFHEILKDLASTHDLSDRMSDIIWTPFKDLLSDKSKEYRNDFMQKTAIALEEDHLFACRVIDDVMDQAESMALAEETGFLNRLKKKTCMSSPLHRALSKREKEQKALHANRPSNLGAKAFLSRLLSPQQE